MKIKVLWELLKESAIEWDKDKCPRLGAALSYYTIFSIAPVLVIAVAIAGMIFGEEAARGQIVAQINDLVGNEGARAIQSMLENAREPSENVLATIVGLVVLLIGATGAFVELQDSLNSVWEVMPRPGRGLLRMLQARLLSFGLVLGVGFLLLVSLVISAAITALSTYMGDFMGATALWQVLNIAISFSVATLLFAMMYKTLPDVTVAWRDVWIGAAVTAFLFSVGKFLIGLYIGNSSVASTYGAAGSLVVLLVWVYYSAQILLFGAEFTQVYANRFGSHIKPTDIAMPISDAMCDREDAKRIAKEVVASQEREEEVPSTKEEVRKAEKEAVKAVDEERARSPITAVRDGEKGEEVRSTKDEVRKADERERGGHRRDKDARDKDARDRDSRDRRERAKS